MSSFSLPKSVRSLALLALAVTTARTDALKLKLTMNEVGSATTIDALVRSLTGNPSDSSVQAVIDQLRASLEASDPTELLEDFKIFNQAVKDKASADSLIGKITSGADLIRRTTLALEVIEGVYEREKRAFRQMSHEELINVLDDAHNVLIAKAMNAYDADVSEGAAGLERVCAVIAEALSDDFGSFKLHRSDLTEGLLQRREIPQEDAYEFQGDLTARALVSLNTAREAKDLELAERKERAPLPRFAPLLVPGNAAAAGVKLQPIAKTAVLAAALSQKAGAGAGPELYSVPHSTDLLLLATGNREETASTGESSVPSSPAPSEAGDAARSLDLEVAAFDPALEAVAASPVTVVTPPQKEISRARGRKVAPMPSSSRPKSASASSGRFGYGLRGSAKVSPGTALLLASETLVEGERRHGRTMTEEEILALPKRERQAANVELQNKSAFLRNRMFGKTTMAVGKTDGKIRDGFRSLLGGARQKIADDKAAEKRAAGLAANKRLESFLASRGRSGSKTGSSRGATA